MHATRQSDCGAVERLLSQQCAGIALTGAERAVVAAHLARCRTCRGIERLWNEMDLAEDDGPCTPLDTSTEERWLSSLVARSYEGQASTQSRSVSTNDTKLWLRAPWGLLAGACGAAAAAVLLVLVWPGLHGDVVAPDAPSARALSVTLLFASGRSASAMGSRTASKSPQFEPAGGRIAVAVGRGVRMLAAGDAALRVESATDALAILTLDRGQLFVAKDPGTAPATLLVETPHALFEVTGTVFSIEAREDRTILSVRQGVVTVTGRASPDTAIGAGESFATPGDGTPSLLSPAQSWEPLDALLEATQHVSTDGATAELQVTSEPTAAHISVDDIAIGLSPVLIKVEPGEHRLVAELKDFAPAVSHIQLMRGEIASEHLSLSTVPRDPRPATTAAASDSIPSLTAFLREGDEAMAARDWERAARAYTAALRHYPLHPDVRAVRIALANLELEVRKHPTEAVRLFSDYLESEPQGVLAEEALYGLARSHRALGASKAEGEALREFVERFPSALRAASARARLRELSEGRAGDP